MNDLIERLSQATEGLRKLDLEIADVTFHDGNMPPIVHCDVPQCVNPDHLFVGTAKDNVQDCVRKGRQNNHNNKKTHCPQGHPYDTENTYQLGNRRHCKECIRECNRRRYRLGLR